MTKNIIAFGASNSKKSINKIFSNYTAHQIPAASVTLLDLNDFEMPIYSIDRERESGIPERAKSFKKEIENSDGIVISFAEHNGSYTAAFKNIFDWISRLEGSTWDNKPMLLLSTSPGGRGGKTVLEAATKNYSFMNKSEISSFSLPSFKANFDNEKGITDSELNASFKIILEQFNATLQDAELSIIS